MFHRYDTNLEKHIPLKSLDDFKKLMWTDTSENQEASLCIIGYHWLYFKETMSIKNEPKT